MLNPKVIRSHEVRLGGFGTAHVVIKQGECGGLAVQNCGLDPFHVADMDEANAAFDRLVAYHAEREAAR